MTQPQPTRLEEQDLEPFVARAQAGDADAFEQIVLLLQGPVRGFCRRMMKDIHVGDDAAQESFVRVWRGLGSYRPERHFLAWVFTISRNTCIELMRKQSRVPTPVAEPRQGISDPTERATTAQLVQEAIDALDEPYRSTFLLREQGFSYDDIADGLSVPVGTVRSRLHQARRRLAEQLEPLLFGGDDR